MHALCRLCMLSLNVYTTIYMCVGNDGSSRSSVWTEDVKDPSSNPASSLKFVKRQFFYNTTKLWCFASQMCFMYGSFIGRRCLETSQLKGNKVLWPPSLWLSSCLRFDFIFFSIFAVQSVESAANQTRDCWVGRANSSSVLVTFIFHSNNGLCVIYNWSLHLPIPLKQFLWKCFSPL